MVSKSTTWIHLKKSLVPSHASPKKNCDWRILQFHPILRLGTRLYCDESRTVQIFMRNVGPLLFFTSLSIISHLVPGKLVTWRWPNPKQSWGGRSCYPSTFFIVEEDEQCCDRGGWHAKAEKIMDGPEHRSGTANKGLRWQLIAQPPTLTRGESRR